MSDETTNSAPAMPESFSDPREAMNWLAQQDEKKPQAEPNSSAESAEAATAEHESEAQASDAAQPEEAAPSETEGNDAGDDNRPPVERPRSWSKDDEADWKALPRAMQEKIAAREQARETELRRTQNEAAERAKAVEAERAKAENKVQTSEKVQNLRLSLAVAEQEHNKRFAAITSQQKYDELREQRRSLVATDPVAALELGAYLDDFVASYTSLHSKQAELQQAEKGLSSEFVSQRTAYAAEQDKLLHEVIPEFKDPAKYQAALQRAVPILNEYGLSTDKLAKWCESEAGYQIVASAGFQRLVNDALKYRDVMAAATKAKTAPVPPVQRPGVRQSGGGNASALQAATQAFNLNPTAKNAAALALARRQARAN
jgi:hypothetical protein